MTLEAPSVDTTSNKALGDAAFYPSISEDMVIGINSAVGQIIDVMQAIVAIEPTLYNSETLEYFWGPFDNNDGFGTMAAYIRDMGDGEEFRYHYALLRGLDGDVATMQPIIWGGATPDPDNDDFGRGVTLWDFEANTAWEEANDPNFTGPGDEGRFVAVYSRGMDGPDDIAIIVAAFRNFLPADSEQDEPVDLDYLYGHVDTPDATVDFVDWAATINIDDDPDRSAAEEVDVAMAFLNGGMGRAEAFAEGGDLGGNYATAIECWNDDVNQTYTSLVVSGDDEASVEDGSEDDCGDVFQQTLETLGIPALGDVDSDLLDALDDAAENGVPAE